MKKKEDWIVGLSLIEHPEGGYYKETYRSSTMYEVPRLGPRNLSTGICFLLDRHNFSAFHKIKSDEMWHFYAGDPLLVHMVDEKGNYSKQLIGLNIRKGESPQFVVPANVWFASEVVAGGEFSLVGCTVSFGFDFRDFELANSDISANFPDHEKIIERLIRK